MAPYNYSYYGTRGDQVATVVCKACADTVQFERLLKKNKEVRAYWQQIQAEELANAKAEALRIQRAAEAAKRRAEKQAAKDAVIAKLTPEEREAFGFTKKAKSR